MWSLEFGDLGVSISRRKRGLGERRAGGCLGRRRRGREWLSNAGHFLEQEQATRAAGVAEAHADAPPAPEAGGDGVTTGRHAARLAAGPAVESAVTDLLQSRVRTHILL